VKQQSTFPSPIKYAVGIDPDIKKSGLAVWSRIEKRLLYAKAVPFPKLLEILNQIKPGEALFFVDAGWLNGGYFHWMPDNFDTWSKQSQKAYLIKRGIDVGRNFGVGQVIVTYLQALHGLNAVHEIRPSTEKWSAEDLKRYTGWTKPTNPESRDAAKLCFQR